MNNAETTKKFLDHISKNDKNFILEIIAKNYGIKKAAVLKEITTDPAENILEYIIAEYRDYIKLLFRRFENA